MNHPDIALRVSQMKVQAFNEIWNCRDIPARQTGDASVEARALRIVTAAAAKIEREIRQYERANP